MNIKRPLIFAVVTLLVAAVFINVYLDDLLREFGFLAGMLQDLLVIAAIVVLIKLVMLDELRKGMESFRQWNAAGRIDMQLRLRGIRRGPIGRLWLEINKSMDIANDQFAQIAASASRLVPMSKELADTYNAISQASVVQSSYSDSVQNGMEDMVASANRVATHTEEIGTAVEHAEACVDTAKKVVEQTVLDSHRLAEQMEHTGTELANLRAEVKSIGSIIDMINSVAEQTNLLALNAAIEAARAGAHGRGFAVVAQEVRTLAGRTHEATTEVHDMVSRIQEGTRKLDLMIRQGIDSTMVTVQRTDESKSQLDSIREAVVQISGIAQSIKSSNEHQQQTAGEAKHAVLSMMDLNASAINNASNNSVGTEDLLKLAAKLKEKLQLFNIGDTGWDENRRSMARNNIRELADVEKVMSNSDIELF